MQTYLSGEEVRLGDIVRWPHDEGKIVGLQEELPKWGLSREDSEGKAMIEFQKTGLICEHTATEDLALVRRSAT